MVGDIESISDVFDFGLGLFEMMNSSNFELNFLKLRLEIKTFNRIFEISYTLF